MKYAKYAAVMGTLVLSAFTVYAAVNVTVAPVSLVTSTMNAEASSDAIALFSFTLTGTDSETLDSVTVTVNNSGSSSATEDDLDSVAVYKDDGDGSFDAGDTSIGSESDVNIGSVTTIDVTSDNSLTDGVKYFVTLKTSSSWGEDADDKVTVTLGATAIGTSADSPNVTAVTTSTIGFDGEGPELTSAVAGKVGDNKVVVLTFNEATNKPTISDSNIEDELVLNNSHTWLDGDNDASAAWNTAGTVLTVTLDDEDPDPTVAVGDTVTVTGDVIEDASGNEAFGTETITGNFTTVIGDDEDCDDNDEDCDDEDEDGDDEIGACTNTLRNGRIYKLAGAENTTVYLAAACRLKPFRGAAAFHARGHKFQNIIILSSLSGFEVSDKPAVPAGGTIVKGSDTTVWVVTKEGKRKGFVSANAFTRLGFKFDQVDQITDTDLATIEVDTPVTETDEHPDGTVAKCGNSATVFEIKNNSKHPFASAPAFELRGHSWDQIAVIDCGRFAYLESTPLTETAQ